MIRKDVFSVKEYDRAAGAWCHVRMFYCADSARKYARSMCERYSIVNPAEWIVNAYIAYGNAIYN